MSGNKLKLASRFTNGLFVAAEREIVRNDAETIYEDMIARNYKRLTKGKNNNVNIDICQEDIGEAKENWVKLTKANVGLCREDINEAKSNWNKLTNPNVNLSKEGISNGSDAKRNWRTLMNRYVNLSKENISNTERNWSQLINKDVNYVDICKEDINEAKKNWDKLQSARVNISKEDIIRARRNWDKLKNASVNMSKEDISNGSNTKRDWNKLKNTSLNISKEDIRNERNAKRNWCKLMNTKVKLSKEDISNAEGNWYKLMNTGICNEDVKELERNRDKPTNTKACKEGISLGDRYRRDKLRHYARNTNDDVDSVVISSSAVESSTSVSTSERTTETDDVFVRRENTQRTKHRIENVTNDMETLWRDIGGLKRAQICHRSEYNAMQKRIMVVENEIASQKDEVKESIKRIEKTNELQCKVCKSTADDLRTVKTELTLQKKDILKSIKKLRQMDDSKCAICKSTASELATVKMEVISQKNEFVNSVKRLKERYDDTKCRECTSTIKELETIKTELASQKEGILNLVKRDVEMHDIIYPQGVQKSSKTSKRREIAECADNIEDKLSKLRITVTKDERKEDGAKFEHLRKQNERIWDNYQIREREYKSPNLRYSMYLQECNLKTGEKLSQLKDEIDDIAGNLEWYMSHDVENRAKSWDDIPHEQKNLIEDAILKRFSREKLKDAISITSRKEV